MSGAGTGNTATAAGAYGPAGGDTAVTAADTPTTAEQSHARREASADAGCAGTAPRPTVSVIICAFTEDRWADLARAVGSLRQQTEPAHQIILVIDHCPRLLRRAGQELPGVVTMPNRFARGLSGSRNTGVAAADGDVVAFMDDDAAASLTWIATLADQYHDARVLGVGGLVRPSWHNGRPPWFPPELDWVVGCSYRGMPVGSAPVRNFIGANMSFRRDVLEELGGFATTLGRVGATPLGCEETELCLRASERHREGILLYEPSAAVSHTIGEHRTTWSYLRSRCYAEGVSKARVARLAGGRRALASERGYLRSAVPRGIGRSLVWAGKGQLSGLAAALAIIAAVVLTGAGYVAGRVAGRLAYNPAISASHPTAARAATLVRVIRRASRFAAVGWASLTVCLALWVMALRKVHLARVTTVDLGLIAVLPVTFWAALLLLIISFCLFVRRQTTRWPVLAAHLIVLVAILHATPAILYGTLRYSWAWKHVGIISFISQHGVEFNLGGVLGAYQGWPGFFALNSFLTSGLGLGSTLGYASWAVPVNHLLWLGPVVLIARTFTSDQRLVWSAAWLFELGNWVGQDYFSPQAFTYFLYLTVLAVCLRWLSYPETDRQPELAGTVAGTPQGHRLPRLALLACLVPLMVTIASSHQLTPFMLIAALTILVAFRHLRFQLLPALMAVITVGWMFYGARPWLTANRSQLLAGLGHPWANAALHLVGQSPVPLDQTIVDWGARGASAVMAVLAVIGFWRYRQRHDAQARRSWTRVALLTLAALPLVAANSYGGEIIFRVYLFALPFLAIAGAAVFFPGPRSGRTAASGLALVLTTVTLVAGFTLGNYGKEAMNYFSPQEVAASEWLYRTAPQGAQVVGATNDFPWAFVHYNWYHYTFLDSPPSLGRAVVKNPVSTIAAVLAAGSSSADYLIFTRSQAAEMRLTGTWPTGSFSRITHDLLTSGQYRVVYQNSDAMILQPAPVAGGQVPGGKLTGTAPPHAHISVGNVCDALDRRQAKRHLPDIDRIPERVPAEGLTLTRTCS